MGRNTLQICLNFSLQLIRWNLVIADQFSHTGLANDQNYLYFSWKKRFLYQTFDGILTLHLIVRKELGQDYWAIKVLNNPTALLLIKMLYVKHFTQNGHQQLQSVTFGTFFYSVFYFRTWCEKYSLLRNIQ